MDQPIPPVDPAECFRAGAPPPTCLADIDWLRWRPVDPATLLFVVRDGQVLLIRKKRGLGAGKVNAPGGRLDPGETLQECAIREVQEELCVTATGVRFAGEHRFQFVDGYSLHVHVYVASDCLGEPTETDEAIPLWTAVDAIPYDEMWDDDRLWIPHLLAGRRFSGRWIFDRDRIVDCELIVDPEPTVDPAIVGTEGHRTAEDARP